MKAKRTKVERMKPILCAGSVVRAFLNQEIDASPAPKAIDPAKPMQWQDRRPIKDAYERNGYLSFNKPPAILNFEINATLGDRIIERGLCPLKVGDVLYVRETFFHEPASHDETLGGGPYHPGHTYYRADYSEDRKPDMPPWKPSIHMPRELSRLFLEVMRVRVERACDISEEDARAEGQADWKVPTGQMVSDAVNNFSALWESLYPGKWEAWVWVYDLKRISNPRPIG